jgi:hypothetical protein
MAAGGVKGGGFDCSFAVVTKLALPCNYPTAHTSIGPFQSVGQTDSSHDVITGRCYSTN